MRKVFFIVAILATLLVGALPAFAASLFGTPGPDRLVGTNDHDLIVGYGGADRLVGNAGTDDVNGGRGADTISGGDGEDMLRGNKGNDTIYAGDDGDSDEVRCGAGFDIAYVSGNDHSANNLTNCEDVRTQ